jgi:hypothetical protein
MAGGGKSRAWSTAGEASMAHVARSKEQGAGSMEHGVVGLAAEVTSGHVKPSDLDSDSSRIV